MSQIDRLYIDLTPVYRGEYDFVHAFAECLRCKRRSICVASVFCQACDGWLEWLININELI